MENLEKVLITYLLSKHFFIYIYTLYFITTNIMLELIKELALVFAEVDGLIVKKFKFIHETKIKWRFLYVK